MGGVRSVEDICDELASHDVPAEALAPVRAWRGRWMALARELEEVCTKSGLDDAAVVRAALVVAVKRGKQCEDFEFDEFFELIQALMSEYAEAEEGGE